MFLSFPKLAACCGLFHLPRVFAPKMGCKVQIQSELSREEGLLVWFLVWFGFFSPSAVGKFLRFPKMRMENPILNRDKKSLCKHLCLRGLEKLFEMLWFQLFYF